MARFIIRRLLGMIPFILLVSFTVFVLRMKPVTSGSCESDAR